MNDMESRDKKNKDVVIEFDRDARAAAADPGDSAGAGQALDPKTTEVVARLQAEKDELMQTMVRRQADFENYRKRVERDREEEGRRGVSRLLEDLIFVLDAFDRALKAHDNPAYEEYRKGLELIYKQLWETAARHGLERIPAADKPFDPRFHQAIDRVETTEHPDGTIVEVLQDGYTFHGRVLRPSIVRVAVAPEGESGARASAVQHRQ
jgi:molecular chaperone GrpE